MTKSIGAAIRHGALVLGLVLATAAQAQAPAPAKPAAPTVLPGYGPPITLEQARVVMAAAEAAARRLNAHPTIAIVEPTGELVMYIKDTTAQYGAYEYAMGKARTAARYRRSSKMFGDQTKLDTLYFVELPNVLGAPGGFPIVVQGHIIGAIGATGGSDEQVAQAGADALK